MAHQSPCEGRPGDAACADLPDLRRLNYFHGQMLGVADFRTEQAYVRAKQQLHNRCLHGSGSVCGLMVVPATPPATCEVPDDAERERLMRMLEKLQMELNALGPNADPAERRAIQLRMEELKRRVDELPPGQCAPTPSPQVILECGFALDAAGREIVVPRPHAIDPWHWLSAADRRLVDEAGEEGRDLYLSICYCEQPIDPSRPMVADRCGTTADCLPGKVRETYTVRIGLDAPPADTCCDPCCGDCGADCLLLAVLRGYRKGEGAREIDNGVRRLLDGATRPATTITGISWTHGATYSAEEANDIVGAPEGTDGLQINFSRPVLASTLVPGVVDVWVLEGGGGKHADVYYLDGDVMGIDGQETVSSFRYRYRGDENLDPGDRIFVTVRCAFILDDCCRPVDGAHVGGRVPIIDTEEFQRFRKESPAGPCPRRPPGYGPWTSGAGTPGASFESWFYIAMRAPTVKSRNGQQAGGKS